MHTVVSVLPSLADSEQLNGRVRRKRAHREKKSKQPNASSTQPHFQQSQPHHQESQPHHQESKLRHQESQLEDSTDGVTGILKVHLNAMQQDDTVGGKPEVIINEGAELSPRFDAAGGSGGGHSSGVVTECEEEAGRDHTADQIG